MYGSGGTDEPHHQQQHQSQQPPVSQVQRPIGMPSQVRQTSVVQPPPGQQMRTNLPGSLGDLVSSFEAVKQKGDLRMSIRVVGFGC